MKSLLSRTPLLFCAATLLVILSAGCNDKITYVPVIKSIDITPDTVEVDGSTIIQIAASDEDDDNLVYYYTTTGGSISGVGDTVSWQAPEFPGIYLARVLVADKDGNQATDSIRLVVVKNDSSSQITGVAALPSSQDFDLAGSSVRIFTSKQNWINHVVFDEVKAVGFGSIVSFRFDNVPVGTYYLDIWKDTDYGNTINSGDYYGWYGKGEILNPNPDPFALEAGSAKAMQIQMWLIPTK